MADSSPEMAVPGRHLPPTSDPETNPPAETFLSKMKRLLFGTQGEKIKRAKTKTSYQFGSCFYVLLVVFVFSTLGCMIMWFTDLYLDSILSQMTLKEGTEIYEAWRRPPVRPLICVHVFNYTNMEDYMAGRSSKIHVNETGPYCYRETLEKTDIKFDVENGTVTYGDRRTHVFEERNSSGSMNDMLVVPNIPIISAVAWAQDSPGLVQLALQAMLHHTFGATTMIKVPAHEFLFGYNDRFVSFIKRVAKLLHKDMPIEKFGILAMRAAETKERLTIKTGAGDLNNIGVVTALNGETQMSAWDDDECNRLDGSDGAFFPRHTINKSATLHLFHKDLCRKLPLVYQDDVDFQDGVMGMRFHTSPDVYNTTDSCYCKNEECSPPGVFDVSPCAMGAPVMMSFPHFMNADPSVTENFVGFHPDPKRHDFFLDIQPILGFTLGTVSRIQLNVQIRKSYGMSMLNEFPDGTILPVVWFEVTADRLPPDLFKMIYHASVTVQWIQWSLQWGFLGLWLSSALGCFLLLRCRRHNKSKHNHTMTFCGGEPRNPEVIVLRMSSV